MLNRSLTKPKLPCQLIQFFITLHVKFFHYRPGVAQRVSRGIALLFHDRSTRTGWVVSSTHQLHFTPRKDPVPIVQEAGWAPGPVWTGGKSRPHWDSIPDHPAHSQLLYRLSYPAHITLYVSLVYSCETRFTKHIHNITEMLKWEMVHWLITEVRKGNGGFYTPFSTKVKRKRQIHQLTT